MLLGVEVPGVPEVVRDVPLHEGAGAHAVSLARMAPTFAWYCGDQARALVAADRPLVDQTPPPSLWLRRRR